MKRYVTDTQCLLWYLTGDRRLSRAVRAVFSASEGGRTQILVPSIVLVEAIFLLHRQRVKEMIVDKLMMLSEEPDASLYVVPLDVAVVHALYQFGPAAVPELADRIIAATARASNLTLLTTDPAIIESGLVSVVT